MKDLVLVSPNRATLVLWQMITEPKLLREWLDLLFTLAQYKEEDIALIFATLGPLLPPDIDPTEAIV